ncbi:2-hydroxyacid dehydrogenase [Roseivirga sp. BDSF3-8]|uniref:2-hydroxyacid dehydrogenase n=1 Tax=Roseivirga sp. BDSF3-8 TaxID=3241598 RepID=UPI003531F769
MKIAFFNTKSYDQAYFDKANEAFDIPINYFETSLNADTATLAREHEAVCVFVNDTVDAEVIEKLAEGGTKVILLRSAGFNHIDIEAAEKHKVTLLRVPAYSPHAVAEHALALIMTLNRKTHKAYNRVRENNFSLERLTGFDLYGKKVGVIGTGKIGAIFARNMQGLGCEVVAFDPYPDDELEKQGVKYLELDELFGEVDIISLHTPLNDKTHHIINSHAVSLMKKGVMIINTSRGALIDTKAVIKGLKDGHIGYLGIDVYEQEEQLFFKDLSETIIPDDMIARLMSFPNVLVTAHQAFFTAEALTEIAHTTLQNLQDFADEKSDLPNEVKR